MDTSKDGSAWHGGLTDKQARFVEEYLVDLDATKAAIRVGYSSKGASVQGHALLRKGKVQAAIQSRQKQLSHTLNITQSRVLNEYAAIAFFDPGELYDAAGIIIPVHKLPRHVRAALTRVRTKQTVTEDGTLVLDSLIWWHTKEKALKDLGEHLGLFDGAKGKDDLSKLTDEELKAAILRETEALDAIEKAQASSRKLAKAHSQK